MKPLFALNTMIQVVSSQSLSLMLVGLTIFVVVDAPAFAQSFANAALLDLFPISNAPAFLSKPSEFVVSKQFAPGQHFPSRWIEVVDEKSVFHAYLMHMSTAERTFTSTEQHERDRRAKFGKQDEVDLPNKKGCEAQGK